MDVERSSLCNCVVNFLLEEKYILTAFELLHELLEDGRDDQAIRLKQFFNDPSAFPPQQISRFNSLTVMDPQSLLEEKEAAEKKLAISEYELRLANEDILKLKDELQKKSEFVPSRLTESISEASLDRGSEIQPPKRDGTFSDLGPLKDKERRDLNCAVKEYLLLAGYRLTVMTFYEEVADQNLDKWQNPSACVPDALRHYYYQYLSSTTEAAEEKMALLMENESLKKAHEMILTEKENLLKNKELADGQIASLTKSLEALQKDLKDKEHLVQDLKQSLEHQRKQLNDCRAEITSLKMHIEGSLSGRNLVVNNVDQSLEQYKDEIKSLQREIEKWKGNGAAASTSEDSTNPEKELMQSEENAIEIHEDKSLVSHADSKALDFLDSIVGQSPASQNNDRTYEPVEMLHEQLLSPTGRNSASVSHESTSEQNGGLPSGDSRMLIESENHINEAHTEKIGLETIQILAEALPKIVPYVLINHREELLPLMMCAIERHPDGSTRDSLTHTLFNLIKRPDEQQRRIIMDACVSLAENVGEMRTETELLPQCWEQINHTYEERRLLVAQSCGELAEFVRPEIRDSLILSIIQQLLEDPATVVREAAARNLAMLLPLFPNTDKYFKVEELMFQLVCDPSGVVVESTLKELVPAVIKWGNQLEHILKILLSHVLGSAQRCPPFSGVEGTLESCLHVLGERERWNIDVLIRMLVELLPSLHQKAIQSCPFPSFPESSTEKIFSSSVLELYARGDIEWPVFEWMHLNCFPDLIQLTCMLPQKEDNLRNRISKYLLAVAACFGDSYLRHVMLPIFFMAIGVDAELMYFPSTTHSRINGLRPRNFIANRLATMGVLPLLLAGVLGASSMQEELAEFLRKILVQDPVKDSQGTKHITEILNAVRFLSTFENHHSMIINILWEMIASSEINLKINAANLLKIIVPYIDARTASTHVLPALVTLGSDQNLDVKYASIDAFGAVAQHFRNDMIVDKIRVQMDAFLEDGSHEATIAVVRALVVAVPHTTEGLRDYLLSKIFQFTTVPGNNVIRRREKADAFCEALRALDATDISAASVRDFLLPAIQNLLKDQDALDPAHKEALEIMLKERSGKTFEAFSKVMGAAHIGLASSVTSFFGEGGLLSKKESAESPVDPVMSPKTVPPSPPAEDTRLRRIMRGGFSDMLRGRAKGQEEANQSQ